ncbi:hypothetical protein KC19_8G113900 [Ceratodon purpureus]|uniref:Uncharacterized protein n=1 Tax=Ceratodon purpureus TaxID=3225 RepID=A0A8T0H5U7_CERPU|nr:hypothetical protein KC19_8G113900 [Ceratodon purpureus]
MATSLALRSTLSPHITTSSRDAPAHHHHATTSFSHHARSQQSGASRGGDSTHVRSRFVHGAGTQLNQRREAIVSCALHGSNGGGGGGGGRREYSSDVRKVFSRNVRFGELGFRGFMDGGEVGRKREEVVCCALEGSEGGEGEGGDVGAVRESSDGFREKVEAFGEALSSGFPIWVAAACVAGMMRPAAFTWIQGQVQIVGLSITMLGMGMTMSLDDLRGALAMPKELVAGVLLQYTVMPTAGALISRLFNLPANYAAGLILVACCPGGTASNVVTYLARGNVALSVLMTAASTFLAVVMTPMLTSKLVGQYVAVDAGSLFFSTLQVVLLPVMVGVLMAHYLPGLVRRVSPLAPSVAVVTVAAICAGAISQSASTIRQSGGQVLAAVVCLHVAGFFFGYILSRVLGFEESTSRTISIEVGMQNSVLGVVLASKHFGNPLTAVPCAVSSVCHSIIGSALARFWRSQAAKLPTSDDAVLS